MISTNMGDIPKRNYLDIKAQQYGFDDYADMRSQGLVYCHPTMAVFICRKNYHFKSENKTKGDKKILTYQ